jgi:hypothetical protein
MNPLKRLKVYGDPTPIDGFLVVLIHEVPVAPNPTNTNEQVVDLYWAREDRFIFVTMDFVTMQINGFREPVVRYTHESKSEPLDTFLVRTRAFPATMQAITQILKNLDQMIARIPKCKPGSTEGVVVSNLDIGFPQTC